LIVSSHRQGRRQRDLNTSVIETLAPRWLGLREKHFQGRTGGAGHEFGGRRGFGGGGGGPNGPRSGFYLLVRDGGGGRPIRPFLKKPSMRIFTPPKVRKPTPGQQGRNVSFKKNYSRNVFRRRAKTRFAARRGLGGRLGV